MNQRTTDREELEKELGEPGPERIWYVGDAFENGFTLEEVHQLSAHRSLVPGADRREDIMQVIEDAIFDDMEAQRQAMLLHPAPALKRKGFSDRRLASLAGVSTETSLRVRARRHLLGILPGL